MNTPDLPEEILDHIFRLLRRSGELCRVLQASRRFHAIGAPILYHEIVVCSSHGVALLQKSLCQNELYCSLVHKFTANFVNGYRLVEDDIFNQLHQILERLTALISLSITFSWLHNQGSFKFARTRIFRGCTFELKFFKTSISCDETMVRFLDSQPGITDLWLEGRFITESPFTLQRSSLPNLRNVRVAQAGPSILAEIIRGRPVESVFISFSTRDISLALDSLQLSTRTISSLSIRFLDDDVVPTLFFPEISRRFADLKELRFFLFKFKKLPLGVFDNDASTDLGGFRSLKHLAFKSSITTPPLRLAKSWYESCPTLHTITLLDGTVWHRKDFS